MKKIKLIFTGGGAWEAECEDYHLDTDGDSLLDIKFIGLKGGKLRHLDKSRIVAVLEVEAWAGGFDQSIPRIFPPPF